MGYPRSLRSKRHKTFRATSGTPALTTSWAIIEAGASLAVRAAAGEQLEIGMAGCLVPAGAASVFLDYVINGVRQGDATIGSWANTLSTSGWYFMQNPVWYHTVANGDIVSGLVTIQWWGKGQSAMSFVTTPRPQYWVKNIGPPAA